MRNRPTSWSNLLLKFGVRRRSQTKGVSCFYRKLRFEKFEDRRVLATFTVTNTGDGVVTGPEDQPGTLRQAVFDAENTLGPDTIEFQSGLTGAILLTQGQLTITDSVEINGPGAEVLTINQTTANANVFLTNGIVTIAGLTITGGNTSGPMFSGAINASGSFTLLDSIVSGNSGTNIATAGIHAYVGIGQQLIIKNSIIENNYSTTGESALFVLNEGLVLIENSLIAYNTMGSDPVEVFVKADESRATIRIKQFESGVTRVVDSTISGNRNYVGDGGGLYLDNNGTNEIINSTISNNLALFGGGGVRIHYFGGFVGTTTISHSTIVNNKVGDEDTALDGRGGGVSINMPGGLTMVPGVTIHHTIIANNIDLDGNNFEERDLSLFNQPTSTIPVLDADFNIITVDPGQQSAPRKLKLSGGFEDDSPPGTNILADPKLKPLQDNGGIIFGQHSQLTHEPMSDSPAIDAGDPALMAGVGDTPEFDQRGSGFTRVFDWIPGGAQIDIGAVELQPPDTTPPTITDVILSGSDPSWTRNPFAFSSIVAAGEQLRPIATQGIDTLEIVFSESVKFADGPSPGVPDGHELTLRGLTTYNTTTHAYTTVEFDQDDFTFAYNPNNFTGTWTFLAPLPDDKYAIHLSDAVTDMAGNRLDADWTNDTAGTPDIFGDDPPKSFALDLGDDMAGTMGGEFRFHFALLAGDSDGDGIVETNPTGANDDLQLAVLADIDGDGVPGTPADESAAQLLDGNKLPLRTIGGGDLNDDEIVNGADLAIWETGFEGVTVGDVDGDGDSDGEDFLLWQRTSGYISAWYIGWETGAAALTSGFAPQVSNVIISGSMSTHDPFSFDTVDGSGSQLGTVPVGAADTITMVFSENVNVAADSLKVFGLTGGNRPTLADFAYDTTTHAATWRFENWTIYGDNYLLSLTDAVTDVDGNLLDGEWTNPASYYTTNSLVSTFPSGDGTPGGAFNFVMTLLPGDFNLDGQITGADYNAMWVHMGETMNQTFTDADYDGDGDVDWDDFDLFNSNYSNNNNLQDVFVLADLNGDFDVDGNDMQTISDNFGMTGATYADGDLNGDGTIDDADLDLAFAQFGLRLDLVA